MFPYYSMCEFPVKSHAIVIFRDSRSALPPRAVNHIIRVPPKIKFLALFSRSIAISPVAVTIAITASILTVTLPPLSPASGIQKTQQPHAHEFQIVNRRSQQIASRMAFPYDKNDAVKKFRGDRSVRHDPRRRQICDDVIVFLPQRLTELFHLLRV